jgi:hypothetical protein
VRFFPGRRSGAKLPLGLCAFASSVRIAVPRDFGELSRVERHPPVDSPACHFGAKKVTGSLPNCYSCFENGCDNRDRRIARIGRATWSNGSQIISLVSFVTSATTRYGSQSAPSNSTEEPRPWGFLNSLCPSVASCSKQIVFLILNRHLQTLELCCSDCAADETPNKSLQRRSRRRLSRSFALPSKLSSVGKPFPPGKSEFLSRRGGKRFPDRGGCPRACDRCNQFRMASERAASP